MNRFAKTILMAAGLISIAGCSKGNDAADAVRNETDATADAMDNRADVLEDQGLENQADAMENQADYSMPMDLHKVLVFVDDSLRNSLQSYPQNNPACETKLIPPESEQDRIWRAIQDFSR